MNKIVELKIEETKAVVGGIKVSAPPVRRRQPAGRRGEHAPDSPLI
jgi:hypothetical protein